MINILNLLVNRLRQAKACLLSLWDNRDKILCYTEHLTVIIAISLLLFIPIHIQVVWEWLINDKDVDSFEYSNAFLFFRRSMMHVFDFSLCFTILLTAHSKKFRSIGMTCIFFLWAMWFVNVYRICSEASGNIYFFGAVLIIYFIFAYQFFSKILINR